jgi:hypothetical protein
MKRRIIQLLEKNDGNLKSLGFLGVTWKKYKDGKIYILTYKRGTNKQYTQEFYLAKCTGVFPLEYTFELINDGE